MRAGSWGVVRRLRSAVSYRLKPVLHRRVEDVPVEDRRPRLSFVAERERTGEPPILHGTRIDFTRVSAEPPCRCPALQKERGRCGVLSPTGCGSTSFALSAAVSYRLKPVLHRRAENVPVEDRRPRLSFEIGRASCRER